MAFASDLLYDEISIVRPPIGSVIKGPVLVVFEDRIMDILKKQFKMECVGFIKECAPAKIFYIEECNVYVYQTPIGAPATAIFMERAIALGGNKFLFFGSCGGIAPEIKSGQLIVPTSAFRAEGTSSYYLPYSDYIEMKGSKKLMELMEEEGLEYISGRVCSTDAMFRETKSFIDRRVSEGCVGIEMESSLISAISEVRGIYATTLLFTDDVLSEDSWSTYEKSAILNHRTISSIVRIVSRL